MSTMICPECKGRLAPIDDKTVRCTVHGGEYRILFSREAPPIPVPSSAATLPENAAVVASASTGVGGAVTPIGSSAAVSPTAGMTGVFCATHPQVQAVGLCSSCGVPVCSTCDFPAPMNVAKAGSMLSLGNENALTFHVCPNCAVNSKAKFSGRRKSYLIFSYVMATVTMTFILAVFLGAFKNAARSREESEAMNAVLGNMILWPAIAGTVLGAMSLDKRLGNPPAAWIALIWNGSMLGLFLLLAIVGLMMK